VACGAVVVGISGFVKVTVTPCATGSRWGACGAVAVGIGGFVEATVSPCAAGSRWAACGAEAVGIGVAWGGLVEFGGNFLPYLLTNVS